METKNTKKTDEMLNENEKLVNDWFNSASSAFTESYKKQLNLVSSFYNNIFNSVLNAGKTSWSPVNFSDAMNGDGKLRSFFTPFSWPGQDGNGSSLFTSTFENFMKQVNEYNQNLMRAFQRFSPVGKTDVSSLMEKYQRTVEEEWQTARNIMNIINESFSKQLDYAAESNKKTISELNKQMNRAIKSNEDFWASATKTKDTTEKEEKPRKSSEKEVTNHQSH